MSNELTVRLLAAVVWTFLTIAVLYISEKRASKTANDAITIIFASCGAVLWATFFMKILEVSL